MNRFDPVVAERLDTAVTSTMAATGVPGAIVGWWSPGGEYVRAFGVADTATAAPMATDVYHRIGSVTKTFTVTALLRLVDDGRVGLDDPISDHVNDVPGGERISLRHLAGMQSGLANYSAMTPFRQAFYRDPQRTFTPRELLTFAFAEPADFAPGAGFGYSNTNTVLLGLVVEKVTGNALPDHVRDSILIPLKLDHTSFPGTADFPAPHAQGYALDGAGRATTATDWNPSWGWAAGAMISTLDDMRVWAGALATGALLEPGTQRQRLETVNLPGLPPGNGYGLGIFDLAGWIGHNGSLPGYQTVVVHLRERETTLVVMTDTDVPAAGGEPSAALATAITEIVTPDHVYVLGG